MKTTARQIALALAALWILIVFIDFWQYQALNRQALEEFAFRRLVLPLTIGFVGVAFLCTRFYKQLRPYMNGFSVVLLGLLLLVFTIKEFARVNDLDLPPHQIIQFLGSNLATAGAVFLVIASAFAAGDLLLLLLHRGVAKNTYFLLRIALGIVFLTLLLFLLGTAHVLYTPVVWGVLLLPVVLNGPRFLYFILRVFWTPIKGTSRLNMVGILAFMFLVWWVVLNLVFVNRPFPLGFDAATLYVNISSLIDDYHGLVVGKGLYNWSLFAALGVLLFEQTEITLALTLGGSVLALFAIVTVARQWLDTNLGLVVALVFFAMPMVNWLSYKDIKVDVPLLFFLAMSLYLFTLWLMPRQKESTTPAQKSKRKKKTRKSLRQQVMKPLNRYYGPIDRLRTTKTTTDLPQSTLLILLGILAGFSIGIKLTAVLWLFVLFTGILYHHCGYLGFWSGALALLGLSLLVGLDEQAGLRYYNLSAQIMQWILLAGGLGMLVYLFWRQRAAVLKSVTQVVLIGAISVAVVAPWIVKNVLDSGKVNRSAIIEGPQQAPTLNIDEINRIYNNLEKTNE